MPHVHFELLAPNSRVWVFGASDVLSAENKHAITLAVDEHLSTWRAHGVPLVCSREWRDDRFLAIGVDEAATGASGCSIDGMFRVLQSLQSQLGTSLVGGGTIYWRDASGTIQSGARGLFVEAIANGEVTADTPVFDLTIATVGDWQANFERPLSTAWHARLLKSASANG